MTSLTTTNPHTTEMAHDAELLSLLNLVAQAHADVKDAERRTLEAASIAYVGSSGDAQIHDPADKYRRIRGTEASIADGAVYFQAKTFTRGEEGYWVRDASRDRSYDREAGRWVDTAEMPEGTKVDQVGRRRATVNDALESAEHVSADVINEAEFVLAKMRQRVGTHEEAYTGWARYFLVTSSAGHVHSSMHCSTCNIFTSYAPVVALSAMSATEAIEALGETLCTVCFPDAPVDGRPSKLSKAKVKALLA